MWSWGAGIAVFAWLLAAAPPLAAVEPEPVKDLTELSLAELADVEVTTLSRRPQRHGDTAAAVHVVTGQDVRRLGASTIPHVLRMAPGLQVAQIDSSKVAVGIRGFPGRLSRSMLVLVDGRSVYNTLYAGTLWETPDVVLHDVERIEVIRGPGGALWGANAVNGIVNIITRGAAATTGGLLRARVGGDERQVTARWGDALSENAHYRVWTKLFDRDGGENERFPGFDDWRMGRLGARADWTRRTRDAFTLDAALYRGEIGQVVSFITFEPPSDVPTRDEAKIGGGHVLGRWRRSLGEAGTVHVQGFYDVANRDELHFDEDRDTFDLEATHNHRFGTRNELAMGAGYRRADVATGGIEAYRFDPADRVDTILSAFVQHEIRFRQDRVRVSAGAKLEHNPFSNWELQPNFRVLARAGRHTFWGSVARAVRTPSRTERDVAVTRLIDAPSRTFLRVLGSEDFMSERVQAFEAGWRGALMGGRVSLDVAAFHNRYDELLGLQAGSPFTEGTPTRVVVPLVIGNLLDGRSRGLEVSVHGLAGTRGGLQASWSFLKLELDPEDPGGDRSQEAVEGYSPRHRLHVLGWLVLPHDLELSATLRHAGELPGQNVAAYTELDGRLAWTTEKLEIALIGRNLLHPSHKQWGGGVEGPTALRRAVVAQVGWRF